jgi:hypothetical protein
MLNIQSLSCHIKNKSPLALLPLKKNLSNWVLKMANYLHCNLLLSVWANMFFLLLPSVLFGVRFEEEKKVEY